MTVVPNYLNIPTTTLFFQLILFLLQNYRTENDLFSFYQKQKVNFCSPLNLAKNVNQMLD